MKFGTLRNKARPHKTNLLKAYFTIGMILIFFIFLYYTSYVLKNIQQDIQVVPDLYSKFIGLPDNTNLEEFLLQYFMTEIIPKIEYPIILTDSLKVPFSWENIDIDQDVKFQELRNEDRKALLKIMKKMNAKKNIIALKFDENSDKILGYVFYGETASMKQLQAMPYIEIGMVILFTIMGIYGILSLKRNEENMLWVGLAKETAHQFGTPISSLLGWLDIVAMKIEEKGSVPEIITMLNYMKTDIDRLNKVASRFGKVGSSIKRKENNLNKIIEETITYFQSRLPSFGKKIDLTFESEADNYFVFIDKDLIKWTLENLIKNSIDALKNKGGSIKVKLFKKNKRIHLQVIDTGTGLPKSLQKKIFYPGITSKERGWGLGLSLAKRIVEKFHNGEIKVLESEIGKGTTFEIVLKEE